MRIGDVIYDNDTVLIASASFNKEEPCKECFFYDGHECQSNRYTGKDLLSALSRLSSITGDETNDMADTA